MPVIPFVPLIAAGIGGGLGLASQKSANNQAQKAMEQQKNDPLAASQKELVDHQTQVGKWGFAQAQNLLPTAKGAIDLPFEHFKAILSGDPNEFNKVLAGSNQAIDQQTQSARQNIMGFAPRGAIAGQVAGLATKNAQAKQSTYFQAYLNALSGAKDSATQYSNLFNSTLSAGANAGVPALSSLTSQLGIQAQQNIANQAQQAESLRGLGTGLGQIFTSLILNRGASGNSRTTSGTKGVPDPGSVGGKVGFP